MIIDKLFAVVVVLATFQLLAAQHNNLKLLDHRHVCKSYFECVDEKKKVEKKCDAIVVDRKCSEQFGDDFEEIRKLSQNVRNDQRKCVEAELLKMSNNNTTKILNLDKNKFCSTYLFNRIPSNVEGSSCSLRIGQIANRCEALKKCCEPASICEHSTIYSENGRTLSGLEEEVAIKMAECTQNENELRQNKNEGETTRKGKKIKILKFPPFSLCLKYLECQKEAHRLKIECSTQITPFSVDSLFQPNENDATYQMCRDELADDYRKMVERRSEAFKYLDKCVPIANVTREFMITERVCRSSALKERKPRPEENCHIQVARKRKECLLLRDCCVQADVCERSALYAVISDEYLLRRTQLKQNMENCMNRLPDRVNSAN